MKKYEVAVFVGDEEFGNGQWETIIETDNYDEAYNAYDDYTHRHMQPDDSIVSLYEADECGNQTALHTKYN